MFQEIIIQTQVLSHIGHGKIAGDTVIYQAVSVHAFNGAGDTHLASSA